MSSILVLGGTRFFGKTLVSLLKDEGHDVTLLTRGQTPHSFGNDVEELRADRKNPAQMQEALQERSWDIVYDQSCYHPEMAKISGELLRGRTRHYIFTSSQAVYPNKPNTDESGFDPKNFPIPANLKNEFSYTDTKRISEAILTQSMLPLTIVRFPVVLGRGDYSQRLEFHLDHIHTGGTFPLDKPDLELSFIHSEDAARFLLFCKNLILPQGALNACSDDPILLRDLFTLIAHLAPHTNPPCLTEPPKTSPFARDNSLTLNTTKAKQLGYSFEKLEHWLKPLIQSHYEKKNS